MTSRRLLVTFTSILAGVLIVALCAGPVSAWYLRRHHSTALATIFVLLKPPPDLYTPVFQERLEYGNANMVEIEFRYAGTYAVRGSLAGPTRKSTTGFLKCGTLLVEFKYTGRVFALTGGRREVTGLGYFEVDGGSTGKALQCEILLNSKERGGESISIRKIPDL